MAIIMLSNYREDERGEHFMLGENIRLLRKNKGMTQEELASKLKVVRQTVSKWEKGFSVPDADTLQKLAVILETDVKQLLGAEINTEKDNNEIAEQLSRINEQLAIKNQRSRRVWKIVGFVLLTIILCILILIIWGGVVFIELDTSEVSNCIISDSLEC